MKKNLTIYDIAAEAGVSPSTVSRVLNDSEHVSQATRDKVTQVIARNEFTPSSLARAMNTSRTKVVGVVLPDIMSPYFSSLFFEIERCALQYNYSVMLCNTLYGGSNRGVASPFNEDQYFETMTGRQVDGVLVLGGQVDKEEISEAYVEALNRLSRLLPVVVLGQSIPGCDCLFVNRNLGGGVRALIQHLAALGNTRIGFVGGEAGVKQTTARVGAFREAAESLNLTVRPSYIALTNYYTRDGYTGMMTVLDRASPRPTAILAINDAVAIGAMRAITDCGLTVPDDVAVVSCDQFLDSDYCIPRLTTLDQQNEYIARLAVMMLISAIGGVREEIRIEHNPRLIIRESCGSQLHRRRD